MNLLFASAATLAIVATAAGISATAAAQEARPAAPGFYRFRLGDFRITVLSGGTAPRDLSIIMSKPDAVRSAFDAAHEALPVELSTNAYLIDTGHKRIHTPGLTGYMVERRTTVAALGRHHPCGRGAVR
jgi:hypothetical protein